MFRPDKAIMQYTYFSAPIELVSQLHTPAALHGYNIFCFDKVPSMLPDIVESVSDSQWK